MPTGKPSTRKLSTNPAARRQSAAAGQSEDPDKLQPAAELEQTTGRCDGLPAKPGTALAEFVEDIKSPDMVRQKQRLARIAAVEAGCRKIQAQAKALNAKTQEAPKPKTEEACF